MSYQPFPGAAAPSSPRRVGRRRRPALLVIGIVVLVAGVVGGLLLLAGASASTEDSVEGLGRAPAGCSTTLEFKETGTFLVFFERAGTVGDLDGGCLQTGDFDRADDEVPSQTLTLTDPDDRAVSIDDASGVSYDTGGFIGEQIGEVTIDDTGDYELTVSPDDPDDVGYAIAIGKDPTENETAVQIAGFVALAGGVVLGVLLIVLGLRRRGGPRPVPAAAAPWPHTTIGPTVMWPPAAPAAPPYAGPPTSFGAPTGGSPAPAGASADPARPWPATPPPATSPGWPPRAPAGPPNDPTKPQPAPDPFSRPPGA